MAGTERILLPTFRILTLIHTRSANSKCSTRSATAIRCGSTRPTPRRSASRRTAWCASPPASVTRDPGADRGHPSGRGRCLSHHTVAGGSRRDKARSWGAGKATIDRTADGEWKLTRSHGIRRWDSDDPDTNRIWWNDTGVHQNLTFSVQPDPISGMQCWHQRVRVTPAESDDQYGDVVVDTARSRDAYLEWLAMTRPAPGLASPGRSSAACSVGLPPPAYHLGDSD
ncbi:MAG: hypothetical protein R2695_10405 [Acidimicrobiales bacterium]